jgi:hypothetical protein
MTNKATRRTALSMLGLAPVSAFAAEDISNVLYASDGTPTGFHFSVGPNSAPALRRLAAEMEAGNVFAQEIILTSKVTNDDFLMHTLSIQFCAKASA